MSPFPFSLSCSEISPKLPALTIHMQLAILSILLLKFCLTKLPLPLCCGPFPPRTGQGVWALAQVYFQDKLSPTPSIIIWGFSLWIFNPASSSRSESPFQTFLCFLQTIQSPLMRCGPKFSTRLSNLHVLLILAAPSTLEKRHSLCLSPSEPLS